ncbi:LysR family transcriptional regulator [Shewanella sp. WXL01]|uniref:LysR family transcriptional regulator n=1 Tax=Shewanella sp. WXL01 TaxID=2709721 RepID=UPI0014385806|nr:LysR family transcriptional regulator [Shewanella sp. WXL01]NKF49839.1 LysR family transcriptional regulator [Shewanella sp. WXL01]
MNFSLAQLQAFVTTAEMGSFQAAATKLNKRSQAISQLVAALEESNNLVLFVRKPKSLEITETGTRLLSAARRALNESLKLNLLLNSVQLPDNNNVILAVDSFLVCNEVSACCKAVAQQYPDAAIEVLVGTTREVTRWVETGKADIGLQLSTLKKSSQLTLVNVFSFGLLFAAPADKFHPGEVVTEEQLHLIPQIVYETVYDLSMDKSHVVSDQVIVTNNLSQLLSLVEEGVGWSVVPDISSKTVLRSDNLVEISLEGGPHYQWMADCVYRHEDELSLAADYLLQKLMELDS